ncbi:MAG TPA: Gfo/Idh/MocA family oxidoreductase [Blastocatellia bacterium]|jgi:predicted dehydrogenase|nr:Gfo/Idh/MocA family oxidoreductase [Blastocatellia bacterium]
MSKRTDSRRGFIKTAAAGAAGIAIGSRASSYANILGSNDRVRVGIVGFSDRTRGSLIPALLAHAKEQNFDIVAVSDIWSRRRDEAVQYINKQRSSKGLPDLTIATARNNEELYDRKDVDAVIVGTADFQHALHGIEAVNAGRDAYVEKPMANTMEDARAIKKAVEDTKKIVQIGTQRRSSGKYQMAYDFIKSGKFGDIVMVEMTWNVNQPGRWRRPKLVSEIRQQDTDWDRYLLNRRENGKKAAWDPRKYLEFRLFWPYSSGIPDQWLVHQIDTVHWFAELDHPRSVVANGGIYQWHDGRKNFDTMTAVFDYGKNGENGKGFQVVYSSRMTNSAGGVKEIYYSNGGSLNLDTGKVTPTGGLREREANEMNVKPNLLPEMTLAEAAQVETSANTGLDGETSANMRNWMECIRSRKTPNADIKAGYSHSVALCMTIAALQTGKRITFDDKKQDVVVG